MSDPHEDLADAVGKAAAALAIERREKRRSRAGHEAEDFPDPTKLADAVQIFSHAMFPRRLGRFPGSEADEDHYVRERLTEASLVLVDEVKAELRYWEAEATHPFEPNQAEVIVTHLLLQIGKIRQLIEEDVEAGFIGDPAARTVDEILVCYPGAIASIHHRLTHALHRLGAPIVARLISEEANRRTGIDIHPGATIGRSFFIDHGTGVVIGETAIIGDRVRLYQHVTLGARTPIGERQPGPHERHARHPIIEDDVVIYAGATILGRVRIGKASTIGGNVWLLDDVAPGSLVVQPQAFVEADAERSPRAFSR